MMPLQIKQGQKIVSLAACEKKMDGGVVLWEVCLGKVWLGLEFDANCRNGGGWQPCHAGPPSMPPPKQASHQIREIYGVKAVAGCEEQGR